MKQMLAHLTYGVVAVVLVQLLLAGSSASLRESRREWRVYSGDLAGTKYSELKQINRSNVRQLKPIWIFRTDDRREKPASTIECNPIVVDGILYATSPGLKAFALDATTGRRIWQFDPFNGKPIRGVNRGVTYWKDGKEKRIFYAAGPFLYSLDARSGKPVKTFGRDGKIDLREGLDRDVFYLSVTANSPGIVYKDLLIVGSVVGEGPGLAAPGHIRAFDVRTGERRWIFHTIPHPGEAGYETWSADAWKTVGGANAWGGFTLDEERGLVFCGTGSPSYDHYGGNRIGQNLFANCILALQAETGELQWYFQVVHHDVWDYDLPCPPNLVTVERAGEKIDAVAQVSKMGHLFLLSRESGEPLFPIEERPVPKTRVPGEETWPTQPFPVLPPPYAQQRFTSEEVTNISRRARADILKRLEQMRTGGIFLPPDFQPSVVLPQFNGGTNWGGAAFDPTANVLYVNASNEAEWISLVRSRPARELTLGELGQHLYAVRCSTCHGNPDEENRSAASSLNRVQERLTSEEMLDILEHGRGQMPSFAGLSQLEKEALVALLFDENEDRLLEEDELELEWFAEIPYVATGHRVFRDPDGFPANQRPWGTLSAIDLNTGKILWQSVLGTYPELEAGGYPPTGTFNMGGPVVTAGGLVFIAATMDERFRAFDKKTGEVLWEFQMDAGGYATPATYEVDGRQYVVIAAGGGGKPETRPGNAYYCFALPD